MGFWFFMLAMDLLMVLSEAEKEEWDPSLRSGGHGYFEGVKAEFNAPTPCWGIPFSVFN